MEVIQPTTEYQPLKKYSEFIKQFDISQLTMEQVRRLAEVKVERLRQEKEEGLLFYDCFRNPKQAEFHRSPQKIRLLIGGNRSGKTVAGAMESVWLATGKHPFRKVKVPNHGWVVSLDFPSSRDIAEQEIRRWLPRNMVRDWSAADRIITLTNGSTIGFKSCESGYQKFGGVSRNWIWFDEQPNYLVYQESLMRTIDVGGLIWITMTPTEGMSWIYDEIYELRNVDPEIAVFKMSSYTNPWLDPTEIKKQEERFSPEERAMRIDGEFVQFSGLILKNFDTRIHVIPDSPISQKARFFRGIDHGENNPTACLWIYAIPSPVDPSGQVEEYYIYDEYYETDKPAADNARAIREITGGRKIEWSIIDPSTNHRSGLGRTIRKEYQDNGVPTRLGNNDHDALRAARDDIRKLLEINPVTKRPQLFIYDTCINTIKEAVRWRYKEYRGKYEHNLPDEPAKVSDHTMQALCYLMQGRPRFYREDENIPEPKVWYR